MDINSLPHAPQSQVDAMMKSKKVIPGLPSPEELQMADAVDKVQLEPQTDESMQISQSTDGLSENSQEAAPEEPIQPVRSSNEDNIRIIRKRAAEAEKFQRERDELALRLQQYEQSYRQQPQQKQSSPEEEPAFSIGNDDLVEGKHLNKVDKELRDLKAQLKNYQQQSILATTEARLKSQFQDFDQVVSAENIATLKIIEPELSAALDAAPDLYVKAVSAYKLIKRHVQPLMQEEERTMQEKKRIHDNLQKPRLSPTAGNAQQGDSALSKANAFSNGLTKDVKEQLWKELQAAKKNY